MPLTERPNTRLQPHRLPKNDLLGHLHEESIHELLGLGSGTSECAPPEKAFCAHDMHDEDGRPVKTVEDPAGRLHDLAITSACAKLPGAAATFRVISQLPSMLNDSLDQRARGTWILNGDVVGDCLKISNRRLCPDYLSHLERRFSACA